MNSNLCRTGAMVLIGASGLGLTACGSDSTASPVTDNVAAEVLVDDINDNQTAVELTGDFDFSALKSAVNDFRSQVDSVPNGIQSEYDAIATNVDKAAGATGTNATNALDDLKRDIDVIDAKITDAGDSITTETQTAWDHVKSEFANLGL